MSSKPRSTRMCFARLVVVLAAVLVAAARARADEPITGVTLLEIVKDRVALEHAVKSRIYREDRDTMSTLR